MNKIMILGAGELQIPIIKEAKNSGYKVVVVSPNEKEPGFKYADYKVIEDVTNKSAILDEAKNHNIVGIISDQTDLPMSTIAYVSGEMGLPGNDYDVVKLFSNKFKMREKCKDLGLDVVPYRLVSTINEAKGFFTSLNKPVIIKPVDNQGSKGVYKVESLSELIEKFPLSLDYSNSKNVLIEQYVYGEEFVVEAIVDNYQFQNLIYGDTHYFNLPDVFSATKRIFPSRADKNTVSKILEYNKKVITGFNLKQGITHSEYIYDGERIFLIETAARGGGVFISSDIISSLVNLNTEKFLLNLSTGNVIEQKKYKYNNTVAAYIAFFLPEGIVTTIDGMHYIDNNKNIIRHNLNNIVIGNKTKPIKDKTSRYFMILHVETHSQLDDLISEIKSTLEIFVKTDKGMKPIIWE